MTGETIAPTFGEYARAHVAATYATTAKQTKDTASDKA